MAVLILNRYVSGLLYVNGQHLVSDGGNERKLFAVRYNLINRPSLDRSTCPQVMS